MEENETIKELESKIKRGEELSIVDNLYILRESIFMALFIPEIAEWLSDILIKFNNLSKKWKRKEK